MPRAATNSSERRQARKACTTGEVMPALMSVPRSWSVTSDGSIRSRKARPNAVPIDAPPAGGWVGGLCGCCWYGGCCWPCCGG